MGYDSRYALHLYGGSEEERIEVINEIETESGYTFNEKDENSAALYEAHWYDCDKHVEKVAKKHPDIIIEIFRQGEDREDNVAGRYKGRLSEIVTMKQLWPPFTKIMLPREKENDYKDDYNFTKNDLVLLEEILQSYKDSNSHNGTAIKKTIALEEKLKSYMS